MVWQTERGYFAPKSVKSYKSAEIRYSTRMIGRPKGKVWLVVSIALLLVGAAVLLFLNPKEGGAPVVEGEAGLYVHDNPAFAVRYPEGFILDTNYTYAAMGEGKEIKGVSFTVPKSLTEGTNLSSDTRLSIEWKDKGVCSVADFLEGAQNVQTVVDEDAVYVVGVGGGAGAGNRYEEAVYVPGGVGCTAVRYFIHSTVVENYPEGTVKAFDRTALMLAFDGMRRSFSHEGALD